MKYIIPYILLFFNLNTQSLLGATVMDSVPADAAAWGKSVKGACLEVMSVIDTTIGSRKMYVDYLQTPEAIADIQSHIAGYKVDAEKLKADMDVFIVRLQGITEQSQILNTKLEDLLDVGTKEEDIHALLNCCMWSHFNTSLSTHLFLYEIKTLLEVYPEVFKIYKAELDVLKTVFHVLLPLASTSYQADFRMYKPKCKAKGCLYEAKSDETGKFVRDSSFGRELIVQKDALNIVTSSGAKVSLPFLRDDTLEFRQEVKGADMVTKARTGLYCLYSRFPSGFEIQFYRIPEVELNEIKHCYGFGDGAFKEELRRKEAEFATKKAKSKQKRVGSASTTSSSSTYASEALELLADEEPDASSKHKKSNARKFKDKKPITDDIESSMHTGLEQGGAEEDAIFLGCASEKEYLKQVTLRLAREGEGKYPVLPQRSIAHRIGLSKGQKNVLWTLLGEPLPGTSAPKSIKTIEWEDLVSMLEGLGFSYMGGDTFVNAARVRLHLHTIHYDDNRINFKLLHILQQQLDHYGFSKDVLRKMVSMPSGIDA